MRILFLSKRVPFPPVRGDKIITWQMVQRLHARHDLTCVAFCQDDEDVEGARELTRRGISIVAITPSRLGRVWRAAAALATGAPLTTALLGSRRFAAELRARVPSTDAAVAFSSSMGGFLLEFPALRRILHFCELDSDKWSQYAEWSTPPLKWIYARESHVLLEVERELASTMDVNIVCTPLELALFEARIPGASCNVIRNGIDLEYYAPTEQGSEPGEIVFTGVMNYLPNVEGCRWFAQQVLPRVRERVPCARFRIVGSSPSRAVRGLARDGVVVVTGRVPDTRPYLRRASVVVAPLHVARGIQNKVLEGLAMARAVVATTAAAQGVGGEPGRHYIVADEAEAMAEAVSRLLVDGELRHRIGSQGRAFVEANCDWKRSMDAFEALVDGVTRSRTTRPL